jgi:hypothetical protein
MATYRQDITRSIEPAAANPRLLTEAARLKAEGTVGAIKAVAGTVFDAYAGAKQAGLEADLKNEVNALQGEMDAVKRADIASKAEYEVAMAEVPSSVDEFRNAFIIGGEDPEAVRSAATVFGKKKENEIVARFRAEQQKVMAARDAVPERYNEFMNRSEKILKQYIASNPLLANSLRKVSEEVTGKSNLELYSVNKLYEDVNFIEKQKEARAKAAQQAQQVLMSAYVEDRAKSGVSKTQAMAEFEAVTPEQRLELANASVQTARSKEEAKAALEAGGNQILNFATITVGDFSNALISKNSHVYARLMTEFKLSRADIAAGNIPDSVKNSPQYKTFLADAGTQVLQLLDAQYSTAVEQLNAKAKQTPADAEKVKTAKSLLDSWYKEQYDFYTKNPTSWLTALATKDDRESTVQKRLTMVDTLVRGLGIPADVVAQLGMTGDKAQYDIAVKRYPRAAAIIQLANTMREKALAGVGNDEWAKLLTQISTYQVNPVAPPPTTPNERLASLSVNQQLHESLQKDAIAGVTTAASADAVTKYVLSSFHDPANTEQVLAKGMTVISRTMSLLSPEDKASVIKNITEGANAMIYSENIGHGDKAKKAYLDFVSNAETFTTKGRTFTTNFVDETGNSPLKLVSKREVTAPAPVGRPAPRTNFIDAALSDPTRTNNTLAAIDDMLRVQSMATGIPIQQLRQDFIKNFNIRSSAPVSATYIDNFKRAAAGETPAAPAATPAAPAPAPAIPAGALTPLQEVDVNRDRLPAAQPSPVTNTQVQGTPLAPAPAASAAKPAAPAASAARPGEDNTKVLGLTSADTLGYQTRGLFAGEDTYFKQNPNVAGMATEDGKIIINPYSTLSNTEKKAVVKNEAFRLYMRENNVVPNFAITPQQKEAFKNTEYGGNETALKQTIVARILTGDTSALATPEQKAEAKRIQQQAGSKGAAKPAATSSGKEWWEQ